MCSTQSLCPSPAVTVSFLRRIIFIGVCEYAALVSKSLFSKETFCYPDLWGFSSKLSWKGRHCFLEELLKILACIGLSNSWNSFCSGLCLCWSYWCCRKLCWVGFAPGTCTCSVTMRPLSSTSATPPLGSKWTYYVLFNCCCHLVKYSGMHLAMRFAQPLNSPLSSQQTVKNAAGLPLVPHHVVISMWGILFIIWMYSS